MRIARMAVTARMAFAIACALPLVACVGGAKGTEERPVTKRDPDVGNIASTPADDLNLSTEDIPEVLQRSMDDAYSREGIETCGQIADEIAELDAALGLDFDEYSGEQRRLSAGRLAKSAVGSLIPFRGIVRELSGAARNQREFEEAITAGAVRRGYLKGLGETMGCAYPARPVDPQTRAANAAAAAAAQDADDGANDDERDKEQQEGTTR